MVRMIEMGSLEYIIIGIALIIGIYFVLRSPFHYPYFYYAFDVSGKRMPQIEDYIDRFLNAGNFVLIQNHNEKIKTWKETSEKRLDRCWLKGYRRRQYQKSLNDEYAYVFSLTRQQTRYRQQNYVKTPYKVTQVSSQISFSYESLKSRNEQLKAINYECTLREYHSKDQRKLLTKELRQKIMIRDNYTCQICGKYMPDGVGLHIDHLIPVSKGGKSVESNLQVLCSKCNGSKSNKM